MDNMAKVILQGTDSYIEGGRSDVEFVSLID